MPGTFIIRPIEANLTHNTDILTKMNPYCSIAVGNTRVKGQVCKKGGKHPHWNDAITLPPTNESKVLVQLMDKDRISHDDNIGSFMLDLQEVQATGQVSKWYPLYYKNKAAGEILLETVFQPAAGVGLGQGQVYQQGQQYAGVAGQSQYYEGQQQYGAINQNQYYQQEQIHTAQPTEIVQEQEVVTTTTTKTTAPTAVVQENIVASDACVTDASLHSHSHVAAENAHVWTEQRQVVEPHTFMKEVEVVETRSALKEIEVMEPVKVLKDVQYTQAVPVKKQIEVVEPQVVVKEVEVIEPRLVTKTIQVVENVPVTRQIEVVEMVNAVQEVETIEPQTFTKQVAVTEYQPVTKQVEVTQPVTLKKAVEFVEPVITTQTITKELQQPVIVDEKITTTVGPASVIGMSAEYGVAQLYGEITLAETQRITGLQRWVGYDTIFLGLNEQERLWEQLRLSRLSEQEWLRERERLMALSQQQRLNEQRAFFSKYRQSTNVTGVQQHHHHHRWHGLDNLFHGLNEKERLFEQERISRLNDQEWNLERQRLLGFNDQDRLLEQRRLYGEYQKTGGFSHYKKTTETIEQTTTSGQQQTLGQNVVNAGQYHPSPNF